MKILLLTNKDIASYLALNNLFQTMPGQHHFQVLLSSSVGKNTYKKPHSLLELAIFEQNIFNQMLFPTLQNKTLTKDVQRLGFNGFKTLGIEVSDIHSINCDAGLKQVAQFAPDLIVSIRFGLILQSEVIAIPKFGVINLHSGELPRYRGVMATFRAMQHGDTECGTSVHYIRDGGIDSGEIITISKQALDYQRSYLYNTLSLYKKGIEDVVNAISEIENTGSCQSYAANSKGNYFSFPTEQALNSFQQKGLKLFEYQDIIDIAKAYN
jgi:methionyl-tRNA formyltransferase